MTHESLKITIEHFQNQKKDGGKKESDREKIAFQKEKWQLRS